MVEFYVYEVVHGIKRWTDIAKLWKQEVIDKLKEDGYTLNDDGTVNKKL